MSEQQSRRLATILEADIAGYSALMGADEEATVRDLKAHKAAILPIIALHGGRSIGEAGDGFTFVFESVKSAVECGVAVQRTMANRNVAVDPARRMQFRIGINHGHVVFDGVSAFGEAVNVAARLETAAEPGNIWISASVYEQIKAHIDVRCDDVGFKQFKNIAEDVRVYRVDPLHSARSPGTVMPGGIPVEHVFTADAKDKVRMLDDSKIKIPYTISIGYGGGSGHIYIYDNEIFTQVLAVPEGTKRGTPISIGALKPVQHNTLRINNRAVLIAFNYIVAQILLTRVWQDDNENKVRFYYRFYEPHTSLLEAL